MKKTIYILCAALLFSCSSKVLKSKTAIKKPTILVLGGLPSTTKILEIIPDSIRKSYHFISFNRPGFGESNNETITKEVLIKLAKEAGLQENDFGVIGISSGAPMALLLASKMKLKHCGIINGMVTKASYLKYADGTVTKQFMEMAKLPYTDFEKIMLNIPSLDNILIESGTKDQEKAIRAFYDELNFLFSEELSNAITDKTISIDWWHAEKDKNVKLESVQDLLKDFENSNLRTIPRVNHAINPTPYLQKLIHQWNSKE